MILSMNFFSKAVFIFSAVLFSFSSCAVIKKPVITDSLADEKKIHVSVFPVENLSGTKAPLKDIGQSLINGIKKQGLNVLDNEVLEKFMAEHRIRYTGGIDRFTAETLREETGSEAVILTSLELYNDIYPPRIALTARLVSTGDNPVILWMDSIGLAGDDSPGILGLGLIKDPLILQKKALQILLDSLTKYLSGRQDWFSAGSGSGKFQPKIFYHSPVMTPDTKYTVAVIPFFNWSERKYAGEIMVLHFIRELARLENFDVIEPGVVRNTLLRLRIIMNDGISIANADAIFSELDADIILTGNVMSYYDYQGPTGEPKVDFSVLLIEKKSREVVWSSSSYNKGDNGVFFFDWGRVNTAHSMASEMSRAVIEEIVK